jgi:hypothetical protein
MPCSFEKKNREYTYSVQHTMAYPPLQPCELSLIYSSSVGKMVCPCGRPNSEGDIPTTYWIIKYITFLLDLFSVMYIFCRYVYSKVLTPSCRKNDYPLVSFGTCSVRRLAGKMASYFVMETPSPLSNKVHCLRKTAFPSFLLWIL